MKKILIILVLILSVITVSNIYADSTFVDLCKTGALSAVTKAINGGADVNSVTSDGITALMSACQNTSSSSVGIVSLLLNKGADVNAVSSLGKTALDYAKTNTKYGQKISAILEKAGAVASSLKNSSDSSQKPEISSTTVTKSLTTLLGSK